MIRDTVKVQFKELMEYLYPAGLAPNGTTQLRNLVYIYVSGCFEGLCMSGNRDKAQAFLDSYHYVRDELWVPDGSWKWW